MDPDEVFATHRVDDGSETHLPIRHFFRPPEDFTAIERRALDACRGRVLDGGAGTGLHTLELQRRGLEVRAVDLSPVAVEVMRRRGVRDARRANLLTLEDGTFDTLLLLGHGIAEPEGHGPRRSGRTFWFSRKKFSGSYLFLSSTRRS